MCWMSNSCLWSVSSWLCQFGSRFVGTTLPPPRPSFHQLRRILCWTLWVRVMALTFNSVLQTEYVSLTELHVSTTCEVHVSCNYRLWQYTVHWSTFDIIVVILLFECALAWKNGTYFAMYYHLRPSNRIYGLRKSLTPPLFHHIKFWLEQWPGLVLCFKTRCNINNKDISFRFSLRSRHLYRVFQKSSP